MPQKSPLQEPIKSACKVNEPILIGRSASCGNCLIVFSSEGKKPKPPDDIMDVEIVRVHRENCAAIFKDGRAVHVDVSGK